LFDLYQKSLKDVGKAKRSCEDYFTDVFEATNLKDKVQYSYNFGKDSYGS
jgi:hypothetical protein